MNKLKEVTYQYTNVADPTESAAKRQRVLQNEEEELMETTAARIIEAASRNVEATRLERTLPPDFLSHNNPDTNPPGLVPL